MAGIWGPTGTLANEHFKKKSRNRVLVNQLIGELVLVKGKDIYECEVRSSCDVIYPKALA
jgi:hypothetical protein